MSTSTSTPIRVMVLHNSLSPYRLALFREISRLAPNSFKFIFAEALTQNREWETDTSGMEIEILKTKKISLLGKHLHLWWDLDRFKGYDVLVLNDHLDIPSLLGLAYAKIKGIPSILWSANTINALGDLKPWQVRIKKHLARYFDHFMAPGSQGSEYFKSLGMPADKIHICNNVVDNSLFAKAREVTEDEKKALKTELGLTGPVAFYCGQFIARKGLDTLIEAVDMIDPKLNFSLLALGGGPLQDQLQNSFKTSTKRKLSIPGFVQPSDIYKYYAISDVFILPAHIDTWGMVVNEAMAAGVPVIVSTGAGAHADMVQDGQSGMVFAKGDAAGLAKAMERVLSSSPLRDKMIKIADTILEQYTLETAAKQFVQATNAALSHYK